MQKNKRILLAVDGSAASRRVANYVADIVGAEPIFHVGMIHLELPPRMLEWGGSEDAETENSVSNERADAYDEMEANIVNTGQALMQRLQTPFTAKHVDVVARVVKFEEPLDPKNIAQELFATAQNEEYGTIVVGRHSFSGWKRFFGHHVADELLKIAKDVTVWVVE